MIGDKKILQQTIFDETIEVDFLSKVACPHMLYAMNQSGTNIFFFI